MKLKYLFILLVFVSCQKEQKTVQIADLSHTQIPEIAVADTKTSEERSLKTDTILLSNEKDAEVTHILANLIDQKADKDSVVTQKYRLDFYINKTKTVSSKLTIKSWEKGSEWSASYGLSPSADKNSSFIQISFGYPACGYTHDNYLYYLKDNNLQLVHEWYTMSDSGWGTWVRFSNSTESDPRSFYCKTVSYEPTDDGNEDMGILTYSDSTYFELKDNHWKKQLLTKQDKPYFEKKVSFNEFHDQK